MGPLVLLIEQSFGLERDPILVGYQVGVCRALNKGLDHRLFWLMFGTHMQNY